MKQVSLIALVAALSLGISGAQASDLYNGASTKDDGGYVEPSRVNWSGIYVGGQFGYGIASHEVTKIRTEHFDAVPSNCWAEQDIDVTVPNDNGTPLDPSDDFDHAINMSEGISITNLTEDQCTALLSGADPVGPNLTYAEGFDPAVDAHDVVTEKTRNSSDSGLIGGARVGYDQMLGQRLVAGVFADYNWSDIDAKDGEWSVGGRVGVLLNPRTMAYGLVAYTQSEYGDIDYSGVTAGAGLEVALTNKIFLGLEYSHTFYDEETIVDTPGLKITDELEEDRIMGTLKIKLNQDVLSGY